MHGPFVKTKIVKQLPCIPTDLQHFLPSWPVFNSLLKVLMCGVECHRAREEALQSWEARRTPGLAQLAHVMHSADLPSTRGLGP